MTNAISVKDRLKKQAIEDGKTMQDKLVTYGLERTIYRLSVQCPCCFFAYFLGSKHLIFNFSYIYSSFLVIHLIFLCIY